MALTGNPDKKMLMRALARRRDNQFDNFFDRLITELFITGTTSCFTQQILRFSTCVGATCCYCSVVDTGSMACIMTKSELFITGTMNKLWHCDPSFIYVVFYLYTLLFFGRSASSPDYNRCRVLALVLLHVVAALSSSLVS